MRTLLVLAIWFAATPAAGQHVLGGRYSLVLPTGMMPADNPRDSHGLAQSTWTMTRAELRLERDSGLVMVAIETFSTASPNFAAQVGAELTAQGINASTSKLALRDGLRGIAVDPPLPKRAGDANLLHATYVAGSDGMVVVIAFYARGHAIYEARALATQARKATATLQELAPLADPGRAYLDVDGRSMSLDVAHGWKAIAMNGDAPNAALEVREVVPLGGRAASCVIDTGALAPRSNVTVRTVKLLGTAATWKSWSEDGVDRAELAAPLGAKRIRAQCHAYDARRLAAGMAIVQTLRV